MCFEEYLQNERSMVPNFQKYGHWLDKNEKGSRLFSSLPMVIILIQYNNLFQLS